jgi:hypothetical protein
MGLVMVEGVIRERLEVDGGPVGAAFSSVIEHYVQQHADSCILQRSHARSKLVRRLHRIDAITRMRCVEAI